MSNAQMTVPVSTKRQNHRFLDSPGQKISERLSSK